MNSFMSISINEAKKSGRDVPVGAVVVKNGDVIATAHNERELDNDVTSHAEILAIRKAEQVLGNWQCVVGQFCNPELKMFILEVMIQIMVLFFLKLI